MTRSLGAKLPALIAALFVVWALRGGHPEVVHWPFRSNVPIVLDDLLGRYLSAEQQSEEARAPESPEIAPLVSCYHNLLRM